MIRHVHVYSIIAEMILEVEADSEREALDLGRQMADGRAASERVEAGDGLDRCAHLRGRQ